MNKAAFESKSLAIITLTCYTASFLLGLTGMFFPEASFKQLFFYQANDAVAIAGSVIAARYVGLKGEHVGASAFILLGITHGVSMASSGINQFNIERGLAVIMPMIPALTLMGWCSIFPVLVRWLVVIPVCSFVFMYISVVNGGTYYSLPLYIGYGSLMILEILWGYFIFMNWRKAEKV